MFLAQVFSCDFCEISKNFFSYRTTPVAASVDTPVYCTHIIQHRISSFCLKKYLAQKSYIRETIYLETAMF